nr:class I SAM-dependent methyltransferase [Mesobacillus harenae]
MKNSWNQIVYHCWSPVYDWFFNSGPFLKARKKIFGNLLFNHGDEILFIGVGTGADIEQINVEGLKITAVDYSEAMLQKAREKFDETNINFLQGDAQSLFFPNNSFDYTIVSLLLSVVPNPLLALSEAIRVTKPGGRIIIFDKFAADGKDQPLHKKLLRPLIKILGTDIGLTFSDFYSENNAEATLAEDKPVLFNGMYRKIILIKK